MPADQEAALRHFIGALALGDGFQFHLVICESPRQVRELLATLTTDLPTRRGGTLRSERLAPYETLPPDTALDGEALSALVTERLSGLAPRGPDERLVFALDASLNRDADLPAWRHLFRRMNEQRNALARDLDAVLLLCLSPRLEAVFAQEAPDFWSIRGVSVRLGAAYAAGDQASLSGSAGLDIARESAGPAGFTDDGDEDALNAEIAVARARAAARPDDSGARRGLLILLDRLGERLVNHGRSQEALAAYREGFAIAEDLANAEPGRADYQRDLSVSYEKLGNLYRANGQGEAARAMHQKSLEIAERLAGAEPERADYQWDLVTSLALTTPYAPDGGIADLGRILEILRRLDAAGRLYPYQREWIPKFEERLRQAARNVEADTEHP